MIFLLYNLVGGKEYVQLIIMIQSEVVSTIVLWDRGGRRGKLFEIDINHDKSWKYESGGLFCVRGSGGGRDNHDWIRG